MFLFKRSGIYYIEYFDEVENRDRRKSTGKRTKQEALKFLSEFQDKKIKDNKVKYISLGKFKDEYIDFVKLNNSKHYYKTVVTTFNFLLDYFNDVPLNNINSRKLESYFIERFNETKTGAHQDYRNIRAGFNKAIRWGYLKVNPLTNIKLPKIPKSFPVFINEKELRQIVDATDNKDLKDIYLTGFHTGMRREELIQLRWNAIDFNERIITVKNTDSFTTKSKKERVIPINNTLLSVLTSRIPKVMSIDKDDFVFSKYAGVPYNSEYVSKEFKKIVRKLKLNGKIKMHTLRHSFASNLAQRGVSLYIIKEILGHENISTTQKYAHLQKDSLSNAVKFLDRDNSIIGVAK